MGVTGGAGGDDRVPDFMENELSQGKTGNKLNKWIYDTMSDRGECSEGTAQRGRRERMGAFLDNGEQEGFFEEVVLTQVLAQDSCATKLLGTPFILYSGVGPWGNAVYVDSHMNGAL